MLDASRYHVIEQLGAGGFATVYQARYEGERGFCRDVVLKVLNPAVADDDEVDLVPGGIVHDGRGRIAGADLGAGLATGFRVFAPL